jgi:hypothetical protein
MRASRLPVHGSQGQPLRKVLQRVLQGIGPAHRTSLRLPTSDLSLISAAVFGTPVALIRKQTWGYRFEPVEVHIVKLHVDESLLAGDGPRPHIDADRWRPLIMSFCRFYGIGDEVHPSRLAESDFMTFVRSGTGGPAAPRRA